MSRRFFGLTAKQSDTLGRIAFGMGGPQHPATIKVLLDRGLIAASKRTMRDRMGEYTVTDYDAPLAVNMAYCQWCSETITDEEIADAETQSADPRSENSPPSRSLNGDPK